MMSKNSSKVVVLYSLFRTLIRSFVLMKGHDDDDDDAVAERKKERNKLLLIQNKDSACNKQIQSRCVRNLGARVRSVAAAAENYFSRVYARNGRRRMGEQPKNVTQRKRGERIMK